MNARQVLPLLKETAKEWSEDKAPRLSAALAYYTLFSLAPLLVIAISVAGLVWGETAARDEVMRAVEQVLGSEGAHGVQEMIAHTSEGKTGIIATILGLLTLLLGASGVFGQLKDALNTIWEVSPRKGGGIAGLIKQRFLSFTMVLGVGFLLLVSLILSAGLAAAGRFMQGALPGGETLWQVVNFTVSLAVITAVFALLFKYLPDTSVQWRDVWVGAVFTSVLFVLGKFAIGLYLGRSAVGSTFGAAASLAIILVWLYYSGMIFFFGAEFTEVWARMRRVGVEGTELPARRREGSRPEQPVSPAHLPRRPKLEPDARPPATGKKTSKGALAGVGIAGLFLGAVAAILGTGAIVVKGVRRLVRF